MKIINITAMERKTGNTNMPLIFGLGDDNKVYEWLYTDGAWKEYIVA